MSVAIRSGGQSGADLAGWRAAKLVGLPTAGWMPAGYLTEFGPRPEYAALYNAMEAKSRDYPERTRLNVRDSDATIIFRSCRAVTHRGCDLTKDAAINLKKPYIIVPVWSVPDAVIKTADLAAKIAEHKFKVVNISGSRGSSDPPIDGRPGSGIEYWVESYLIDIFTLLKGPP